MLLLCQKRSLRGVFPCDIWRSLQLCYWAGTTAAAVAVQSVHHKLRIIEKRVNSSGEKRISLLLGIHCTLIWQSSYWLADNEIRDNGNALCCVGYA